MLDAVAADSEFAVESVRAKKRLRSRENLDSTEDDNYTQKYRDPGYSQAVRKTCQQRMVQLIPVRRGTLSVVLSCMWMLWGALLFLHYWIFTRFDPSAMTEAERAASFATRPIAQLFHLRSSHSIAQWLTTQLWMLTAVAAWMIFQLRRHKLDDYRARYRIWVVLAIAAAFSSFEASSSGLLLLGLSIDSWAQREIGYAGWPLVLATFASIIGVIGIRLCSELKSAPMSVVSWLFGLIAWGLAALLGTGLLKISWSSATVDLVVGGCLLGGILAVFQASGIYLRQTYIHAQKRFLVRNGANLAPIQWKVPKFSLRRKKNTEERDEQFDTPKSARNSKWKMPWAKKRSNAMDDSTSDREREIPSKRESARKSESRGLATKPKGRLFGILPTRHELNEKLDLEPIGEDDGPVVDRGLTKKRGWFGIGGNRAAESNGAVESNGDAERQSPAAAPVTVAKPSKVATKEHETDTPKVATKNAKRAFWSRGSSATNENIKPQSGPAIPETPKAKRGWVSKFSKSYQQDKLNSTDTKKPEKVKSDEPAVKSVRRGLFGMLDGLKLKPPTDEAAKKDSAPLTKPVPIKQGQQMPSTQSESDDEEGDDDYSGRPMSKADRKKLRRQSQDDRRAA